MLSRRAILALSIALSLAVHGALLVVAPRIAILRSQAEPLRILRGFRVRLNEPVPDPPASASDEDTTLASRPESIQDLLAREQEELALDSSDLTKSIALAQLAERVAADAMGRTYDLTHDTAVLEKVDAKIIEIAREDARKDIEVARRFVRPSPSRILSPDEIPTLRVAIDDERDTEPASVLPPVPSSLGTAARTPGTVTKAESPRPPYEPDVLRPDVISPTASRRPIEHQVTVAPFVKEIRQESAFEFIDDLVDIQLDTHVPQGEEAGFFRLQILPKKDGAIEVLPKDVTFIVDASNSIVQQKLNETSKGVRDVVATLRPEDRFNIVVFRDTSHSFRPQAVFATDENKTAAQEFVAGLESHGQTDVYKGIRPVLDQAPRPGVPGIVLVMTDGRPTAGVRDGRTIINALTAENDKGNTVFAFGGGRTVNQYLLDLLAYRNKGDSFVSSRLDDIDRDLPKFFARLEDPILVALNADYGQIAEQDVFPKEIPDFYRGKAVTVYGRFDPDTANEFSMRLTGRAGDQEKELVFKTDLRAAASGDDDIARNWAFQKIYYLIGEICRVGETPELLDELRRLSRKYDIRTSYDE